MLLSLESGVGWIHLAHKNADLLLLVSIASLGLLPLVSIYIIETEKYEESVLLSSTLASSRTTSEFLRSCMRGIVYLAILFPYLLALLSTYVSIQLIRGQSLDENGALVYGDGTGKCSGRPGSASLFWLFYRNTKTLKKEDMIAEMDPTADNSVCWKIPHPGYCQASFSSSSDNDDDNINNNQIEPEKKHRLVAEDCPICLNPFQVGERIVWSSNPNCIHCYHYGCLQAWMEPWDARTRRCPCCRQSFFKP